MNSDLVTIARFDDPLNAYLNIGLLKSADIFAVLADEVTVGIAWHLAGALGGIRLMVLPKDEAASRAVLAEHEMENLPFDIPGDFFSEEEELESSENLAKAGVVDRAFKASVIGLMFQPILFYALFLGFKSLFLPGRMARGKQLKLAGSFIFSFLSLGLGAFFFLNLDLL